MNKVLQAAQKMQVNGYLPVPIGKILKYPTMKGWPTFVLTKDNQSVFEADGGGIGVVCGEVVGVDIDVLDVEFSESFADTVQFLYGDAPTRIGRAPKRLLMYRTETPFKKKKVAMRRGSDEAVLEILAKGQQFVAYGIHPKTNAPYKWVGESGAPLGVPVCDLPVLTEADAEALLVEFVRHGEKRGWVADGTKAWVDKVWVDEAEGMWNLIKRNQDPATRELVEECLAVYGGAEDYPIWLECGMMLYRNFDGDEVGFELWDNWSSSAPNYDYEALRHKWGSGALAGAGRSDEVSIGTLIHRTKELRVRAVVDKHTGLEAEIDACLDVSVLRDGIPRKVADAVAEGLSEMDLMKLIRKIQERVNGLGGKKMSDTAAKELSFAIKKDAKDKKKAQAAAEGSGEEYNTDTIDGLGALLKDAGFSFRYDAMSKLIEIEHPTVVTSDDNRINGMIMHCVAACGEVGASARWVEKFIPVLCDQDEYHPVREWLDATTWDGVSRLQEFFETVGVSKEDIPLRNAVMRRWMLSALAGVYEPNGVSAHGVLVLQGGQGMGKTHWFKNLVPRDSGFAKDGLCVNLENKDHVFLAISKWLIELGEISASFTKSDINHMKAFLTQDRDTLRRPYRPSESSFARRTVFFGSVNENTFLHDDTGNRRFWTLACKKINYNHGMNMQQIWRELYEQGYLKGDKWLLSEAELVMLNASNVRFESVNPIVEKLGTGFIWDEANEKSWTWMTLTQIAECVVNHPKRPDLTAIKNELVGREAVRTRKVSGYAVYFMPPRKM